MLTSDGGRTTSVEPKGLLAAPAVFREIVRLGRGLAMAQRVDGLLRSNPRHKLSPRQGTPSADFADNRQPALGAGSVPVARLQVVDLLLEHSTWIWSRASSRTTLSGPGRGWPGHRAAAGKRT